MRTIILSLLCATFLSFHQAQPKKKVKKIAVFGTVTSTTSYCGGARPSDEILSDAATPRPLPNKKIYIKNGEVNSKDSRVLLVLTSDSKGNFRTKLPPGKYLIVDSTKKDMTYYNILLKTYKSETEHFEAIDTLCLKEWHLKPHGTFEVKDTAVKNISVNFHKSCYDVPCSNFRGPFPQ